jgi:uncharacterized protein (DUF427 family)
MMPDFPSPVTAINHTAPVPRRIRGTKAGATLVDSTHALYVWEWPYYPHYYVPKTDVDLDAFVEGNVARTPQGEARHLALKTGAVERRPAARMITKSGIPGLTGTVRIEWSALDHWYEEDEEVFVHPRNPYVRVDALRSNRAVRIELNGIVLAEANDCVMLFETGLPTRYYLDPTNVRFAYLAPSTTRTQCPYKGKTDGYWSVAVDGTSVPDAAWLYSFTTPAMTPIAGLVAFLNERVDIFVEGTLQPRPVTHFT